MVNKKVNFAKIIISAFFAVLVLGAYVYRLWRGEPWGRSYLYFGAICACFLFSLIFIGSSTKKVLITCALAVNVAADYFLVFAPSEENKLVGICVFLGVQFVYAIYTLTILKTNFARAILIGTRIALSLSVFLILPRYITLTTLQTLSVIYIANSFVTLITLAIKMKKEWLTFLGFLLFFICDIFVGLSNGGAEILGITGKFAEILANYNLGFYYYIPGLFLIALSSVWEKKKE